MVIECSFGLCEVRWCGGVVGGGVCTSCGVCDLVFCTDAVLLVVRRASLNVTLVCVNK